jgi:uncharacterized glyoxalase superfamily protein PhnB
MGFDIVEVHASKETPGTLFSAQVRKGKCFVTFRTPYVEELAEFSFIKRCASRCMGLYIEMKKGLDKYYARCMKKGLKVLSEPKDMPDGTRSFSLRDPFGIKLVFSQVREDFRPVADTDFAGMQLDRQRKESEQLPGMIDHLKKFGILRRAAKKFAKLRLKMLTGKAK